MISKDQQRTFALSTNKNKCGTHPEILPLYWELRIAQFKNGSIQYDGPGWYSWNGKYWQWHKRQGWFAGSEDKAVWVNNETVHKYIQIGE